MEGEFAITKPDNINEGSKCYQELMSGKAAGKEFITLGVQTCSSNVCHDKISILL